MGAERAVAHLNAWLERIHVSLNDDLVPYFMDGIKVSANMLVGPGGWMCVFDCRGFVCMSERRATLSRSSPLPNAPKTQGMIPTLLSDVWIVVANGSVSPCIREPRYHHSCVM